MKIDLLSQPAITSIENHFQANIDAISELGKGACNTIFLLEIASKKYCLKIERPDKETDEENDIITEAKIIQTLNVKSPDLPVPYVEQISEEHRFYIYHFFEGEPLTSYVKSNDNLHHLFCQFGVFHAELRAVSKDKAADLGLTLDETGTLHYSTNPFTEVDTSDLNWPDEWLTLMHTAHTIYLHTASDAQFQLIHNDAHDKNIFVHRGNFCFLDFGDAMYGDVHSDFVSYIYAYPRYWEYVIKGYEEVSGITLNRKRLVAFSLLRYIKHFVKLWREDTDREFITQKMDYYMGLIVE